MARSIRRIASASIGIVSGTLTISGNINPAVAETLDLGTVDSPWKDCYLGTGSLFLIGAKLVTIENIDGVPFAVFSCVGLGTGTGSVILKPSGSAGRLILAGGLAHQIAVDGDLNVTGSVTGTFFGVNEPSISFVGSASFAENANTSSFAGSGSIISGGIVIATVGPKIIGFNNDLGSETVLSNILFDIEEVGGEASRTKLDLIDYNEARIIVRVTGVTNPSAFPVQMAPQFSLDETTWQFFSTGTFGGDKPSVHITESITAAGGFVPLRSESKADVFVRLVTYSGSNAGQKPRITVGNINLFFR